ncbi:hypothetical protein J4460_05980 [Candidatus Woesearchaeota archaeon]|nr:hypothetical protein [Candidatus Woesearchaeota archaeon]HIH38147.1 hypothetical protein [Candidatus Woesearchaeota archaeon]HIH49398.1 hypothetical protein [Candidatus Woesearchaeota archaeon]HIJ03669.1 hypothetical protein [Candidatus Woesearchaeota archaeon]
MQTHGEDREQSGVREESEEEVRCQRLRLRPLDMIAGAMATGLVVLAGGMFYGLSRDERMHELPTSPAIYSASDDLREASDRLEETYQRFTEIIENNFSPYIASQLEVTRVNITREGIRSTDVIDALAAYRFHEFESFCDVEEFLDELAPYEQVFHFQSRYETTRERLYQQERSRILGEYMLLNGEGVPEMLPYGETIILRLMPQERRSITLHISPEQRMMPI